MARKKYLRKNQLDVLTDMFSGELDEQQVLDKHNISTSVYSRWLADELFLAEFSRRIEAARLRSQALLARYSFVAAAKLVQLTESEKGETARKACLDIISRPALAATRQGGPATARYAETRACRSTERTEQSSEPQTADTQQDQQLSDQTASRLLAALAEEKR